MEGKPPVPVPAVAPATGAALDDVIVGGNADSLPVAGGVVVGDVGGAPGVDVPSEGATGATPPLDCACTGRAANVGRARRASAMFLRRGIAVRREKK